MLQGGDHSLRFVETTAPRDHANFRCLEEDGKGTKLYFIKTESTNCARKALACWMKSGVCMWNTTRASTRSLHPMLSADGDREIV